ncbi:MAG: FAD-dependent monooxygenase [Sphingomonas sp.]|nr:FAD-dependent monooxygenase [Sphingomonas sp.]
MKIAVIGGGPGGLYFAYLMKKHDPSHHLTVYEQNAAGATYGWGVVFSDIALSFLREADEEFYKEFTARHERCDYMEVVHKGVHVQLGNNHFSRTARIDLLNILQGACRRIGVDLCFEQRITDLSALSGADIIVAADGANSHVRSLYAEAFRPSVEQRRNKFAWYGTHQLFHPVSLIFRETQHGIFIAHSYQYSRDLSTFLVEVDPETWQRAGLDRKSEEESRHFCGEVFRPELGSNELLSNRSPWFQASIVRNENWTHRNIVLLGDACRSVHFSLGSGTRMALQDAIALHDGLVQNGNDVAAAFRYYEAVRRPATSNFQSAADKSLDWYENVSRKMHLDPVMFAYDYMRRTGRVSHDALRERDPRFIAAYEAASQAAA